MKAILFSILIAILASCSGKKYPGKPNTIGGQPAQQFYTGYFYRENNNEFMVVGQGELNFGLLMMNKFGEQMFMMARTDLPDAEPIVGTWNISGRKLYLYMEDKNTKANVLVGEGEGMAQPGRPKVINFSFYDNTATKSIVASSSTGVKVVATTSESKPDKLAYKKYLYRDHTLAVGTKEDLYCLLGESTDTELSILIRLETSRELHEPDEEEEEAEPTAITVYNAYYHDLNREGLLIAGGSFVSDDKKIDLKIKLDGKEVPFGQGVFSELIGQSVLRLTTADGLEWPVSKEEKQVLTSKEMNLFRLSKSDCTARQKE